jgi:pimeloyl-ACP methyl ester carboxylesterase
MKPLRVQLCAAFALLAAGAGAGAQTAPARTLDELKLEVQQRADRHAYPVSQLIPEEVREALAGLKSLDRDEWAAVWSAVGDRHAAQARALEHSDGHAAARQYQYAYEYDLFARFPLENSPGKVKAYAHALDAFAGYARLQDPPIEIVRIPFEEREIVGYLQVPKGVRPAPVLITIGGLDSRKENAASRNNEYLAHGVAWFAFDMPGTGQSAVRVIVPGAEREFSRVLDYIATRPELDARRVAVYGGSWGGHWSARLAYGERARLRGAVVQGGPIHAYFQPEWQRKALGTREYLFELFEARSAVYGVHTLEEFLAYGPRMSLVDAGMLDKPSAPMLVIGGLKDTQVPVEDVFVLMRAGSPKEVWINPQGGHMGRNASISDEAIFREVTLPWIVRTLGEAH